MRAEGSSEKPRVKAWWHPRWIATVVTLVVTWGVTGAGIPALRHDWRWPTDFDALGVLLRWLADGWVANGIGSAQPYPTFYWIGALMWPLHLIANSLVILTLVVVCSVYAIARSAQRIAEANTNSGWVAVAAVAVAALNPWVYSEYVAGHILMVAAYGLLLALVAELTAQRPRAWRLVLLAAATITQIEFFLVAFLPLTYWAIRQRKRAVLAAIAFATLPIAIGVIASYQQVHGTPFNLEWQRAQSIALRDGVLLDGYSYAYAASFHSVWIAMLLLAVAALASIPLVLRQPVERAVAAIGLICVVAASGTRGPLAPIYSALVLRFAEMGVFRELYDLIAFLAIAYVVLLARGLAAVRGADVAGALAAACLLVPWLVNPPYAQCVPASSLPRAAIPDGPNLRVVLLPAFQPLTFGGRGSGLDPDAFVRDRRMDPLNEPMPSYPDDVALASLERYGDERFARALGVAAIVNRPYLRSNEASLRFQRVAAPASGRGAAPSDDRVAPMPLLGIVKERPHIVSIGSAPFEHAVFFGDERPELVTAFEPTRATIDARLDWVDARLGVAEHPEWGNAFGGVVTTSSKPLRVPPEGALLALTRGRLYDDAGRAVTRPGRELEWWPYTPGTRFVRCSGTCVVALAGRVPPGLAGHYLSPAVAAVAVNQLRPWFLFATVPPNSPGTLRFNVRYDRYWLALQGTHVLPHVRLDTALNAWLLDPVPTERTVFLVEAVALVQALAESAAIVAIVLLAFGSAATKRRGAKSSEGAIGG